MSKEDPREPNLHKKCIDMRIKDINSHKNPHLIFLYKKSEFIFDLG